MQSFHREVFLTNRKARFSGGLTAPADVDTKRTL